MPSPDAGEVRRGRADFAQPLSAEAMTAILTDIMAGRRTPEEIARFLTTLAERGETAEEIAAAVRVLRRHAEPLPLAKAQGLCDTCGTGGDRHGTINLSTLAALVAAAAGVRVCKHGNRAASSRCGSADVLEALGLNLEASPAQVASCVDEVGFGFCFAPRFHPAMKVVAPVRKALGIRTLFNLIGPLANPAPLTYQLVGVSDATLLRPIAEALGRLGVQHGLVVHGTDGLDEATTTGPTQAVELARGELTDRQLEPAALGIATRPLEALRGGEAGENARRAGAILRGAEDPATEAVVLNAGCAIYVADQASTIETGIAMAREALRAGRAQELLARVRELMA